MRHDATRIFPVEPDASIRRALLVVFIAVLILGAALARFWLPRLPLLLFLFCLPLAIAASSAIPAVAEVGNDGLLLRWLWTRRFIPFSTTQRVSLRAVRRRSKGAEYTSGHRLEIERSFGAPVLVEVRGNVRALFDAIQGARRRWFEAKGRGSFDAGALDAFESDGRTWLARLQDLSARAAHYRVDAPTREELLAIFEDPTMKEETRAAAGVVLALGGDASDGRRLRIARDASASPSLRSVIDAAMTGEEESVARALEGVRRGR